MVKSQIECELGQSPAWCDIYRSTHLDGKFFLYESPFVWTDIPLQTYSTIADAKFPPTTFTYDDGTHHHYFPSYDMLIRPSNGPACLFSGAHNRLLYECMRGELGLKRNSKRTLINQDGHDDIALGVENDYDFHIGNWVSKGYSQGFWRQYLHLSSTYTPALYNPLKRHGMAVVEGLSRSLMPTTALSTGYRFDMLRQLIVDYLDSLNGDPFIYTLDTDSLADWEKKFDSDSHQVLTIIAEEIFSRENLELFHFTPSPAYCPHEEAMSIWDATRKIYGSQITP